MIENMAWNIFKKTGDVNAFLELEQIENIKKMQENMQKVEIDGNSKDKGDNNCRK